jgi:RNA-directed DNA polymerase
MTALAPTLESWFTDRLMGQRHASSNTISAYRDTWRLLLGLVQSRSGKQPSRLDIADLDAELIGDFLNLIDERFEFLGFRIQRQTKRGSNKRFVYTWPSRKSLSSIMAKVKKICRQGMNNPLSDLLRQLNGVLRGWTNYFRHGVSKDTFQYLAQYGWERVVQWIRRKHRRANWGWLRRRYLANGWWPEHEGVALFRCGMVPVSRYRYCGTAIPSKWVTTTAIA